MKRFILLFTTLSMFISCSNPVNVSAMTDAGGAALPSAYSGVAAGSPATPAVIDKDGYTLVPTLYGKTGIDALSSFILTAPPETALKNLLLSLTIDNQPAPVITKGDKTRSLKKKDGGAFADENAAAASNLAAAPNLAAEPNLAAAAEAANVYTVTPAAPLMPNSLYIFRLKRDGKSDITWAFQTAKKFLVTSGYPYNGATNVPVDTGVEITFSCDGYAPIDGFFNIAPETTGRFEYHKNTAVFVPDKLEYGTLYKITLKAGVKLEGTDEESPADYAFAFETEPAPGTVTEKFNEYVSFPNNYIELPASVNPKIAYYLNYNHNQNGPRPVPSFGVYRFGDAEQALDAVQKLNSIPYWAAKAKKDNRVEYEKLYKVTSFDAAPWDPDRYYNVLEFPQTLPQGFYLVEAAIGESAEQMVIQINNLPVQVIADGEKTLVWVNDAATGGASAGAEVLDAKDNKTYKTDAGGVAVIDRALDPGGGERLTIKSADEKTCVWFYASDYGYYEPGYYSGDYFRNAGEAYWSVLQLDRTLFKRDDAVSFFGFAQNRKGGEKIENITVVLTQGYGYGAYGTRDILHSQVTLVDGGFFTGETALPNLDAGSYCLTALHGEIVVGSVYFTVMEYVKPPYKITAQADKIAAFAGETVAFSTKAEFFEGTPVSELDVSYEIWGYWLDTGGSGTAVTDINGKTEILQDVIPKIGAQGETGLYYNVEATLPEIGRTSKSAYVRVFVNDIDMDARAVRDGTEASLTLNINTITLDRLNAGAAERYDDYLDKPVAGKQVSADVYRVYYEKANAGTYYDYINKKNVQKYRYMRIERKIDSFGMVTDSDGKAVKDFTVPGRENESYYATVSCYDGHGRKIEHNVYIGPDYSDYFNYLNSNEYYLDGAADAYDIGDEVGLTLKRGTEEAEGGNVLYVAAQRGIQHYQAGANKYSFTFAQKHVPNVNISVYYFNGFNYQSGYYMNKNLIYDYEENNLEITAATDKDTYKPGDMCVINLMVKDKNGKGAEASVNVSVVDEALFALRDYDAATLPALYRGLGSGLKLAYATHRAYLAPGGDENGEGGVLENMEAPLEEASADAQESETDSRGGDDAYLREIVKDTAFFGTARSNALGKAVYTFKLPDNITSWRLTASAIGSGLFAGNSVINIPVSNPMFINYSLNDEFLAWDTPQIGVNAYGTGLTGGEIVDFEVWDENDPGVKYFASGAPFERVNIPLWKMENEGANALIVRAAVRGGGSDAVKHRYNVRKTYREIDAAAYYDVTAETVFDTGDGGLTNITFTDRGRGALLCRLFGLRNAYGDRLEKLLARREAGRLLYEYFPDIGPARDDDGFDVKKYQREDGGIAILPFAKSDAETTVKALPYISGDVNINSLKNYLYGVYEGDNSDCRTCALYGLALLKEPVLTDLENYSAAGELSVKDRIYVALGYCALGETEIASGLYDAGIGPEIEHMEPYCRVNTGADNDDILEATSAANTLAGILGKPEKDGLYLYCTVNHTVDILVDIEMLAHIERELAARSDAGGSISYSLFGVNYKRELKNGAGFTLRIPVRNISGFKLSAVGGDVGAVSVYKTPMYGAQSVSDNGITVRRSYYKANAVANPAGDNSGGGETGGVYAFDQGDLVRVELWIDYSAKDITGAYRVTDYLPSGLEYVNGSAKTDRPDTFGYGYYRYCAVEGQKVMFYDYNGKFNKRYLYYYYARVINPGTFKAEGALVQNLNAKDYYTLGGDSTVTIS